MLVEDTVRSFRITTSRLIATRCIVVTVQRALGHATATTTLNTYSHLWPTAPDNDQHGTRRNGDGPGGSGARTTPMGSMRAVLW